MRQIVIFSRGFVEYTANCGMLIARATLRIADASTTAHLDKVEHGYENMDHFSVEFRKESRALCSIDFIQGETNQTINQTHWSNSKQK